jgi:hypothetical protein
MEFAARFLRCLDAPLLDALTIDLRIGRGSSDELKHLLHDPSFTSHLRTLNLHSLHHSLTGDFTFFEHLYMLESVRLNFHGASGLTLEFWDSLANSQHGTPAFLPNLRRLSLAGVHPGHAQELIWLRQTALQPRLQSLELGFFNETNYAQAQSPAWRSWLSNNVDILVFPPPILPHRELKPFALF